MFVVSEYYMQMDWINGLFVIFWGCYVFQMFRIKDKSDGYKFQLFYKLDQGIIYFDIIVEG